MSESTTAPAPVPTLVVAAVQETSTRRAVVSAHLVAALVIGSVAPFLVRSTSLADGLGASAHEFQLIDVAPQLVAVLSFGLALLARLGGFGWLRSSGWLVAAVGLFGLAGLYAQGNNLDGQWLTIALVVVISLQIVGLLFALASAEPAGRLAVAVGVGAGITGGRDAIALLAREAQKWPAVGASRGDAVVFVGLGVLAAVAGLVLLTVGQRRNANPPGPWWAVVRWPVVATAVACVLAVVLTRLWNARLDTISQSYIGGMSDADSLAVQTEDQLVRVAIALVVAAVLVIAALRAGGTDAARWVLVALATGLVLVWLEAFATYQQSWWIVLVAVAGSMTGAALVRRLDSAFPWEAVGLLLAAGLILVNAPEVVGYLAAFGFGVAVSAGVLRLIGQGLRATSVSVTAALGLAAWVLAHQTVAPAAALYRSDLGTVPILAFAVLLTAAATAVFFLLGRRAAGRARSTAE